MPLVSVIVPVYKVEPYLRRCVDSILSQTFGDFELILVDDGSPDNCGAICDEYAARDPRVHVIHQANGGLSAARNAGLDWAFANSKSEYIAFVDSDDWVSQNYLEELLRDTDDARDAIAISAIVEIDETGASKAKALSVPLLSMTTDEYWARGDLIPMVAWAKLVSKTDLYGIRFPNGLIHEDEFTTPKFLFRRKRVNVVVNAKYYYFRREDSITGKQWKESRLVAIDALKWQIAFLEELGHPSAATVSRRRLVGNYANAIRILNHREYRKPLRRELRVLRLPLLSNKMVYECAYPIRSRLAWPFVRAYDLVRRRGVVGSVRQWLSHFRRCETVG